MWKRLLCAATMAHASASGLAAGPAESYPSKPIRLLVGFPAGGSDDYIARVIGSKITERLGPPVIVDNRPGVAGNLSAEIAARANADGYTLLTVGSITLASSHTLYPRLGYHLLKDFSYISVVAMGANALLAHPSLPAKSVPELVALARSKPNAIRYGSAGMGSLGNLAMELLRSLTGMELQHVPYKGGGPAIIGLTGGEVQLAISNIPAALPMIQSKRLSVLAVTSAKRSGALPDVPTVAESGFAGFDVTNTFGILAPAGTPAAVVKVLNTELGNIVRTDDVRSKFAAQGLEAAASTPAQFRAILEAEVAQWGRVIKDANIVLN